MAYIQPDSNLYLLKGVPLSPSYDDTFTFNTTQEQLDYFKKFQYTYIDRYSVIKEKEGVLRLEGSVEDYYSVNYMMFQNGNFGGKWFYAFVNKVEYVNPNTTLLFFSLDVMQSWMFEYIIMPSLIEREHVEDDSLYQNLIPESFTVNERIPFSKPYDLNEYIGEKILVLGFTENPINYLYSYPAIPYIPNPPSLPEVLKYSYIIYNISNSNIEYNYTNKRFVVYKDYDSLESFTFTVKYTVNDSDVGIYTENVKCTKDAQGLWQFETILN